ncbi:MAG: hypothetical protein ACTSX9_06550 [Candidatus Njordarchaeales archaeon]
MEAEIVRIILNALNNPFAIQILLYLLYKREAKLTDILIEVTGYSKYRSVKKTILGLEKAGLIEREILTWGRVKKWILRLTELGERIIREIDHNLRSTIRDYIKKQIREELP